MSIPRRRGRPPKNFREYDIEERLFGLTDKPKPIAEQLPSIPNLAYLYVTLEKIVSELRELYKESYIIETLAPIEEIDPTRYISHAETFVLDELSELVKKLPTTETHPNWFQNWEEKYKEQAGEFISTLHKIRKLFIEHSPYVSTFLISECLQYVEKALENPYYTILVRTPLEELQNKIFTKHISVRRELGYPTACKILNAKAGLLWANKLRGVLDSAKNTLMIGFNWLLQTYGELDDAIDELYSEVTSFSETLERLIKDSHPTYELAVSTEDGAIEEIKPEGSVINEATILLKIKASRKSIALPAYTRAVVRIDEGISLISEETGLSEKDVQKRINKLKRKGLSEPEAIRKIAKKLGVSFFKRLKGVWIVSELLKKKGDKVKEGEEVATLETISIPLFPKEQWNEFFNKAQPKLAYILKTLEGILSILKESRLYGGEGKGISGFFPPPSLSPAPTRTLTTAEAKSRLAHYLVHELRGSITVETLSRIFNLTRGEVLETVYPLKELGLVQVAGTRAEPIVTKVPPLRKRKGVLLYANTCPYCREMMGLIKTKEGYWKIDKDEKGFYKTNFMKALKEYESLYNTEIDLIDISVDPKAYYQKMKTKAWRGLPVLILPERTL